MALPDILRGTYVNILLSDGATPAVFTPVCGLTTRTFTHQINTNDQFTRDCADPENVPQRYTIPTGEQWDITGAGLMNRANLADLQAQVGKVAEWRYEIDEPTGDAVYGGYYAGPARLTQLQITGDDGEYVAIDLTMTSEGPWVFTPVP